MSFISNSPTSQSLTAPVSSAGVRLRKRATSFASAYPDLRAIAFGAARDILLKNTGKAMDPTKVYWHRFSSASSSPYTFTGWEHVGMPTQSMTFLELFMERFSVHDQDAVDDLGLYGGFYSDGPGYGAYNERNEVKALPAEVLKDFWALNFASSSLSKVQAFWREHGQDFAVFARVQLMGAAGVAFSKKQLTANSLFVFLNLPLLASVGKAASAEVFLNPNKPYGLAQRLKERCVSGRSGPYGVYNLVWSSGLITR